MRLSWPYFIPVAVALASGSVTAGGCRSSTVQTIRQSHIDSNVPKQSKFNSYLVRDLETYFSKLSGPGTTVTFEFLRDGPTQTGISYPKYYLWVNAKNGNKLVAEGAVRVAAINQQEFEITNFLAKSDLISHPNWADQTFPAPVVQEISKRLK